MNKKVWSVLALILICSMIFAGCGSEKQEEKQNFSVYSFSGEDENLTVTNGVIVLSDDYEAFYGGNLQVNEENFAGVTSFEETFYVLKDGEKEIISSNSLTDTTGGAVNVGGDLGKKWGAGSISGKFDADDLKNNFFFEFTVTDIEGNTHTYQTQMKVVEVTEGMNEK